MVASTPEHFARVQGDQVGTLVGDQVHALVLVTCLVAGQREVGDGAARVAARTAEAIAVGEHAVGKGVGLIVLLTPLMLDPDQLL